MELKGRLKLIAEKVPHCTVLSDIGTDHAYIPIYLVLNRICSKAVATDIKKGPVMIAKKNIEKFGLQDCIKTKVGNGLECINDDETEVIVIAGMGGMLINNILSEGFNKAKLSSRIILQPMNAIEVVREWIYSNGFTIIDEELVSEEDKIYNVMVIKWTGVSEKVEEIFYHVGISLIKKNDPLLGNYIDKKIIQLDKIIEGLNKSKNLNQEIDRYQHLYDKLVVLRKNIMNNQ